MLRVQHPLPELFTVGTFAEEAGGGGRGGGAVPWAFLDLRKSRRPISSVCDARSSRPFHRRVNTPSPLQPAILITRIVGSASGDNESSGGSRDGGNNSNNARCLECNHIYGMKTAGEAVLYGRGCVAIN